MALPTDFLLLLYLAIVTAIVHFHCMLLCCKQALQASNCKRRVSSYKKVSIEL